MKVNIIGVILFITGVVIIIVGLYSAYQSANYETPIAGDPYATTMDWHMFFMMLPSSVAYGAALIGISEVIRLLHNQHNDKLINSAESVSANTAQPADVEDPAKVWTISETDEEKIYELYSDKAILEIIPSQKEGYCIIKLQDKDGPLNPYIKIVDVSGPDAEEVQDEPVRQEIMDWYKAEGYQK
ncbi:hypothetical protein [Virgibacillus sp. YIM 98842]|uniref:hypothetical protein n=1 Tax=Virgibacillus sp. YIM 98842 TaxID=2663533 RepID=UPI0013DA4C5C|nr:hypothetical protein [Virgibacillus sp. YIM 98842]